MGAGPCIGLGGGYEGFPLPMGRMMNLGWVPDSRDTRDHYLAIPHAKTSRSSPTVDLRTGLHFPVYDQGNLGSCTANALCAAFQYDQIKQGFVGFVPSRLYVYYNEREYEGSVGRDQGAQIRDGIKVIAAQGVCHEALWPYDLSKWATKPSPPCYLEGARNKLQGYARVPQRLDQLKACLSEGHPFVFGFYVFPSFRSNEVVSSGYMPMPSPGERPLGGHAVLCCGFDDQSQVFVVRNSWGRDWGDRGYFYMPYAFMLNTQWVTDIWALQMVTGGDFPTQQDICERIKDALTCG